MLVKDIVFEDFTNYKKTSMFIATCYCDFKCCIESHIPISICQNCAIAQQPSIEIPMDEIFHRYTSNILTNSIVIGGLEPLLQFDEVLDLVKYFREHGCDDDIVIYTGYYPNEKAEEINHLKYYKNIIVKFGRYMPNNQPHYDEVLGINLVSDNQYAEKIS